MNALLKELREGLDVEISDAELLAVYEEVAMASGGGCDTSSLSGGDGGILKPLGAKIVRRKAIEKTKKLVKLRGKITEAIKGQRARTTRLTNRIRNGGVSVQRYKRMSARKGWTYNSKKKRLVRISALERMRRSRGAKRASLKRASKRTQINIKRRRSMRMRKAMGW